MSPIQHLKTIFQCYQNCFHLGSLHSRQTEGSTVPKTS